MAEKKMKKEKKRKKSRCFLLENQSKQNKSFKEARSNTEKRT
jgi:hypothetical protein